MGVLLGHGRSPPGVLSESPRISSLASPWATTWGSLGEIELSAANIAFTIESIAFMPLLGLSLGVSVIAGQEMGEDTGNPLTPEQMRDAVVRVFHGEEMWCNLS